MASSEIADMTGPRGDDLLASLRETRQHYQALVNQSPDAIAIHADGAYVFVNPAGVGLLGAASAEQIVGRSVLDLVHPEDRDAVAHRIRLVAEHGRPAPLRHFRVLRLDGRSVDVESLDSGIVFQGQPAVQAVLRDITERKRSVKALRESHALLGAILDNTHMLVAYLDLDFNFLTVNKAYAQADEKDVSFFPGKNHFDLYPNPENEAIFRRVAKTGEPHFVYAKRFEYAANPERGAGYWDWSLIPARDADGQVAGLVLTLSNVTERVESDLARKESEARLRALVNNLPFNFWAQDASGKYTVANPTCEADWGALVGKTPEEVAPSRDILKKWRANNARAFAGEVVDGEVVYERNGEARIFHSMLAPVWVEGEIRSILGVNIDITERKQVDEALKRSERLYRSLFNRMTEGFALYEIVRGADGKPTDYRFLDINPAFERLAGLDREDVVGKTVPQVLPAAEPELLDAFAEVAKNGGTVHFERFSAALGGHYAVSVYLTSPERLAALFLDTTDRNKAEEALSDLVDDLERRVAERTAEIEQQACQLRALASQLSRTEQRERKRLARILHDHIQQLIVAARMQVEWLKRDSRPGHIEARARGVEGILNEALDASRSLAVDLSPPALHETGLAGGLNWLAAHMLEKNQFTVNVRASAQAEPPCEETRFLLFECARELLLNSVKHSGVREADVALLRTDDGAAIKLIVQDRGKGFDPDVLTKRRPDEVTFGMFGIRERLAHLGGGMEIRSAPGKGARVALTVPVQDQERLSDQAGVPRAEQAARAVDEPRGLDACRVLIVDDHQIMREGLAGLFKTQPDIEVAGEAADGPEAIQLARTLRPDVVIMDVNLGEMDGVEATRRIIAADPEIKVIGLSMHTDSEVALAMREAGAAAYLTKGGPQEDLMSAVRACFRG